MTLSSKGRRHRCHNDFTVQGRPLGHGECAWIMRGGSVTRLKSPKQLTDDPETVVITKGHTPTVEDFQQAPRSGWAGLASSRDLKQSKNKPPAVARRSSTLTINPNDQRMRAALEIASIVRERGGRALIVGGAVRDALVSGGTVDPKDIDLEVFGLPAEEVRGILTSKWGIDDAGASFAVLKVKKLDIDVSLPRRERKSGTGYRGFEVDADPHMSVEEAALRRDFTINAISADPLTGLLIDPVNGARDLRDRVLRHVGPRFAEDPLRVLRGAQFCARFNLTPTDETLQLCQDLQSEMSALVSERVWEETKKMLTKGTHPGQALRFLSACGWEDVYSDLASSDTSGSGFFTQTSAYLDALAEKKDTHNPQDYLTTALAVFCYEPCRAGGSAERGRAFLSTLTNERRVIDPAVILASNVGLVSELYAQQAPDSAIRRLSLQVGRIDLLASVTQAVASDAPTRSAGVWVLDRARALGISDQPLQPLVTGRDLLELGHSPGPALGSMLNSVLLGQVEGYFDSRLGGIAYARRLFPPS